MQHVAMVVQVAHNLPNDAKGLKIEHVVPGALVTIRSSGPRDASGVHVGVPPCPQNMQGLCEVPPQLIQGIVMKVLFGRFDNLQMVLGMIQHTKGLVEMRAP
jgi:hypothetical protein